MWSLLTIGGVSPGLQVAKEAAMSAEGQCRPFLGLESSRQPQRELLKSFFINQFKMREEEETEKGHLRRTRSCQLSATDSRVSRADLASYVQWETEQEKRDERDERERRRRRSRRRHRPIVK